MPRTRNFSVLRFGAGHSILGLAQCTVCLCSAPIQLWRKREDSNLRDPYRVYLFSRQARSTTPARFRTWIVAESAVLKTGAFGSTRLLFRKHGTSR